MSKHVIILGGTGFIGKALYKTLLESDYDVTLLSRNPNKVRKQLDIRLNIIKWDAKSGKGWANYAENAYAIINLAGESIAPSIWTKKKKQTIIESRVNAGKAISEAIAKIDNKPKVVIQASGISYYGHRGDKLLDELSSQGLGFLPDVAKQWEGSIRKIESMGVRLVIIRMGVVLGKDGGFLTPILLPFRLFFGGHLGSGKQWISWIHINDVINAIKFLMEKENLKGVFNLTAPNPIVSREFYQIIGNVMNRPSWLHVPGFILRLIFGQMAKELILWGQRAMPKRLLESGYEFQYSEVRNALENILRTA